MIKSISFWEKESLEQVYDLIIIGAGFVGLSAAISYKEQFADKNILVLERGVIAYGASTRNAGFSCFGSIGELEDDLQNGSLESIKETVRLRYQGLQKLRSLVPEDQMDYVECGSVELFDDQKSYEAAAEKIMFWNEALSFLKLDNIFQRVDVEHGGFYKMGISNPFEGQLNPKKTGRLFMARKKKTS
ncbi:FAD-binding oxidoreductase [Saprospiraceae bacterium]|nr:FAD-binding oxidoreductase [Saprospiraceae bacterium]